MTLPATAARNFALLAQQYRDHTIEFPLLKPVTLAQWALESGWGKTGLAQRFMNYAGMKWGSSAAPWGIPVFYAETKVRYVAFTNHGAFIDAYWARLDAVGLYAGWRAHADSADDFITHITPPWLTGRAPDGSLTLAERRYVRDVLGIAERRTADLFPATTNEVPPNAA